MKFSINDFFNKCDQIRSFLWIWPRLVKKSLTENFIFCAVLVNPQQHYYKRKQRAKIYNKSGT